MASNQKSWARGPPTSSFPIKVIAQPISQLNHCEQLASSRRCTRSQQKKKVNCTQEPAELGGGKKYLIVSTRPICRSRVLVWEIRWALLKHFNPFRMLVITYLSLTWPASLSCGRERRFWENPLPPLWIILKTICSFLCSEMNHPQMISGTEEPPMEHLVDTFDQP